MTLADRTALGLLLSGNPNQSGGNENFGSEVYELYGKERQIAMGLVDWHDWSVKHDIVDRLKKGPIAGDHWQGDGDFKRAILEIIEDEIDVIDQYIPKPMDGRGIVICTSAKPGRSSGKHLEHGYFPASWVNIHELRRHNSQLPITIAYLGFEEMDPYLTKLMMGLGINVLDLRWTEWTIDPMRILAGWETKIYAIEHSPYREVLFLDADNIPLKNVDHLFEHDAYQTTGAIFWPDVTPSKRPEWIPKEVWHAIGLEPRPYTDFESGQLMFDKHTCHREMKLCRLINEYSDYWYKLVFGDKSTFFLAWNKLGTPYGMPGKGTHGYAGSLIQYDLDHTPLFQHCVGGKPTLNGYPSRISIRSQPFANNHIEELRKVWDGNLWKHEHANSALLSDFAGKFHYKRSIDAEGRDIELLPTGIVGAGRARCEHSWEVHECPLKGPLILLRDDLAKPIAVFGKHVDTWKGQWIAYEKSYCTLQPL